MITTDSKLYDNLNQLKKVFGWLNSSDLRDTCVRLSDKLLKGSLYDEASYRILACLLRVLVNIENGQLMLMSYGFKDNMLYSMIIYIYTNTSAGRQAFRSIYTNDDISYEFVDVDLKKRPGFGCEDLVIDSILDIKDNGVSLVDVLLLKLYTHVIDGNDYMLFIEKCNNASFRSLFEFIDGTPLHLCDYYFIVDKVSEGIIREVECSIANWIEDRSLDLNELPS